MIRRLTAAAICVTFALPLLAQEKEDKRLSQSTFVLRTILDKPDGGLPKPVLNKALCVMVFPSVKKVGIGIGGTYGRGVMSCRTGDGMNGKWSAPAMYSLDAGSVGLQLGGSATDFVFLLMTQKAVDVALSGKMKMGADASADAGPSGADAATYNAGSDILTYEQAKGAFAGATVGAAALGSDDDANKNLYGKNLTAVQITKETANMPASAKSFVSLLDKASPRRA